jgi:small-conductance mechanosensitive channel
LTDGLLILGYALILLIAALRVAMALFATAIRSRPLHVSRAAGQHGPLIIRNVRNVLYLLTAFTWLYLALVVFDLEHSFVNAMTALLSAELALGSWAVSLGDVLRFVLVLVVTRYIAKIVVFFLEDDILPRLSLPRGAPVTISRLVRYVIWAIGFVVAIGAAGADMGSVALLVSALGIGIGFGLQNIVNNFVSGLILIFERPIRAGDVVEIGGMVARTKEIGLRASIVRTLEGAEVIVPNSDLVSEQVINWTLSDQQRRVDIPVGVVYGTDPESVLDLLMVAAKEVPEVLDDPSAVPLFIGFGANSLDFELRFWMSHQQEWPMVASRVLVQINRLLREAEIEIPFPQRDLHIRSVAPEVAKAFRDEAS